MVLILVPKVNASQCHLCHQACHSCTRNAINKRPDHEAAKCQANRVLYGVFHCQWQELASNVPQAMACWGGLQRCLLHPSFPQCRNATKSLLGGLLAIRGSCMFQATPFPSTQHWRHITLIAVGTSLSDQRAGASTQSGNNLLEP